MSVQRRSTRSELTHIRFAIEEALDFLQATVEFRAESHGDLTGPILSEQSRWSGHLDWIENLRGEFGTGGCSP